MSSVIANMYLQEIVELDPTKEAREAIVSRAKALFESTRARRIGV